MKELFTNQSEILSCESVKPCKDRKNSRAYYVRTRDKSGSNSPPFQCNVQIPPSLGTMHSQMPGVCPGGMLKFRIDRRIKLCRLSKQLDSVTENPFVFCRYKVSHVIGQNTHSRNIFSVHGFLNLSVKFRFRSHRFEWTCPCQKSLEQVKHRFTFNQSINQSINQLNNQQINQLINQSVNQSINLTVITNSSHRQTV